MTVRIVTDSACDLTEAEIEAHGIDLVPLSIRFGEDVLGLGIALSLVDAVDGHDHVFGPRCA